MCGRYTLTTKKEIIQDSFLFDAIEGDLHLPRYNIAPSQLAPVLYRKEGKTILTEFRWGLIPVWSKDAKIGNNMINARAETLMEKRTFNRLIKKHRCLVLSDGFYEWVDQGVGRVPLRITLQSKEPYAFAGLWDHWKDPQGKEIRSYTIITTSSKDHSVMEPIHHRMPVVLDSQSREKWMLDSETPPLDLLNQFPSDQLNQYEVSRYVNIPKNDTEKCIEPV